MFRFIKKNKHGMLISELCRAVYCKKTADWNIAYKWNCCFFGIGFNFIRFNLFI